jgi:hypothetical protein
VTVAVSDTLVAEVREFTPNPLMTTQPIQFSLPQDAQTYHSEIIDRCTELINFNIWGGLHPSRLRSWVTNFRTDEEKYFAACILDNLIYRSKDQTIAMLEQLFERVVPDLARLDPTPIGTIPDCLQNLRESHPDPGLRLVTAVKNIDPPTKSAHEIARFMKRYLSIREQWIIKPWEMNGAIRNGINVFIFIDDFLGTGEQFDELLTIEKIDNTMLSSIYAVYAPLTSHEVGLQELAKSYPSLRVKSVELLKRTHGVFHQESNCFADGVNTPDSAKEFYYNLLKKRNFDLSGPDRRGFGHLELTYAFEHATPDNSLPILWWAHSTEWTPLFDR